MGNKHGFYVVSDMCDEIGFSFNILYSIKEKNFQISLQLGILAIGIGYMR